MRLLTPLGFLLATAAACAEPPTFSSGTGRVALIELYTSEGCSSCPPAERWLADLRGKPGLWTAFVPVAFHVNYWDALGWTDRLSSKASTDREYAYAAWWGARNVYTPCFVRNGGEWRPQWGGAAAAAGDTGVLKVTLGPEGACWVDFIPVAGSRGIADVLTAHVALLAGGITSRVTAGENSGATLAHEFAVVGMADGALTAEGGGFRGRILAPRPQVPDAQRRALAAWVTRNGSLEPIQATGGWLP
jgi:hypothetical protein